MYIQFSGNLRKD